LKNLCFSNEIVLHLYYQFKNKKDQITMKLEIIVREGLSILPFRCSTEPVRVIFGEPDSTEELDNQCDGSLESIVWNYDDLGLNFFFDATGTESVLCTIESDNSDTEFNGRKIFSLTQPEIISLMKSSGYEEYEEEDETWGEHRITFDDAQIDFYFIDEELTLVSWSSF
jgi:hypothetical protein